MTSVAGHLFNTDFPDELQDWDAVDPAQLFDAPVEKRPTKATVLTSLRNVLWQKVPEIGAGWLHSGSLSFLSIAKKDTGVWVQHIECINTGHGPKKRRQRQG